MEAPLMAGPRTEIEALRHEVSMLRRWKHEATRTLDGWDGAFEALPESVRARSLGRIKSSAVHDFIVDVREATS